MAVYVDNMHAKFGRMIMCHMVADTKEELLEMADRIGVQRKWIQKEGTRHEHFDVSLGAKEKAIALGAKEVSQLDIVEILAVNWAKKQPKHSIDCVKFGDPYIFVDEPERHTPCPICEPGAQV